MEVANLTVEARTASGTKQVRNLRDTGKIPMVIYGGSGESLSLQADYVAVKRHLEHRLRVYKLSGSGTEEAGYLQHVQWDTLTDEPLHLDLRRIDMSKPLHLEVRYSLLGHARGVAAGGRLINDMRILKLKCDPSNVPDEIEIKIAHMQKGDKILGKDLELPAGCELDFPEDGVVLHIPAEEPVKGGAEAEDGAEG